jgi:2-polyprenyl-3-methyl-5-hydroxy-6-metoxy-1,4-benzoquinol methylase
MDRKAHWDAVYRLTQPTQISWYQAEAVVSRTLIQRVAPDRSASIIDVGGGESVLVDNLVAAGYRNLTVLDVSAEALQCARTRLNRPDVGVRWLEADVLTGSLPAAALDVWHDRAVFHFLLDPSDRRRYVQQVRQTVRPEGHLIVATFAHDGPSRCSGLDVARYTPDDLHAEFGDDFELVAHEREEHITPFGTRQAFVYCLCRFHAPVFTGV